MIRVEQLLAGDAKTVEDEPETDTYHYWNQLRGSQVAQE
jgi:hypothetical protein